MMTEYSNDIPDLRESAGDYVEKFQERLKDFMAKYEADEIDLIKKHLEYFSSTLRDLEDEESSSDGFSYSGIENFIAAKKIADDLGDKFFYSTRRKIKFLEDRMEDIPSNNVLNQNSLNSYKWSGDKYELCEYQFEDSEAKNMNVIIGLWDKLGLIDHIKNQLREPKNSHHLTEVLAALMTDISSKKSKDTTARYLRKINEETFWNDSIEENVKKILAQLDLNIS